MPRATFHVSVPEDVWIHELSVTYPDASFQVKATVRADKRGIALLEIQSSKPLPILTEIEDRPDIASLDLLWTHDQTAMVQVETTDPRLLFPVMQAGIPVQTPFEVTNGMAIWELAAPGERLSALGSHLESAGIDYEIESIHADPADSGDHLLTERQRELLVTAAEKGYYETPRRTTLTEVSASLGISKATGSEVLHRAEGKVLHWFLDQRPTATHLAIH
jgi:predicted DNA binding protein